MKGKGREEGTSSTGIFRVGAWYLARGLYFGRSLEPLSVLPHPRCGVDYPPRLSLRYTGIMRNLLSIIGVLLLLVAIALLIYLGVDYVRLSAAASTLNRSYPNPIGYVVLTAIISLLSGLFFGLGLRSGGRRHEPEISPRP